LPIHLGNVKEKNSNRTSCSEPQKTASPASPTPLPKREMLPFPSRNIEGMEFVATPKDQQALILEIAALSSDPCSS
jgi:hypothetical protein